MLTKNDATVLLRQTVDVLVCAVGSTSCGITITDMSDPSQPLIFVNDAFEQITGYSSDDVIGNNCRFLQGQEVKQPGLTELRTALKKKVGCSVTLQNYRKDGTAFWNELVLSPVFDNDAVLTHYIGVQTDITRRKKAEDDLIMANSVLDQKVQERTRELELAYDATLEGWVKALDIRDHETQGHTQRVTNMAIRLSQAMEMTASEQLQIQRGALMHDIGKIGIPDSVLLKPGRLNDEEWATMRKHPIYAHEWLSPIAYLSPALAIPYCHHEKWDGSGYPRGLKGEEIPLAARLFAIVDVWDALSSDRPYRKAWEQERVIDHLRSLRGTHFEPGVLDLFLRILIEDNCTNEELRKAA